MGSDRLREPKNTHTHVPTCVQESGTAHLKLGSALKRRRNAVTAAASAAAC